MVEVIGSSPIGPTMYTVYILQSMSSGKYYVGHTENLKRRIEEHNAGRSQSTRGKGPWQVRYTEDFATRSDAMHREYEIKSRKSKIYVERLITPVSTRRASRLSETGRS